MENDELKIQKDGIVKRRQLFNTFQEFQNINQKEASISLSSPSASSSHSDDESKNQNEESQIEKQIQDAQSSRKQIHFVQQASQKQSNSQIEQPSFKKQSQSKQIIKERASFKFFAQANFIKRFVANMIDRLNGRRFKKLQDTHFALISDQIYFQQKLESRQSYLINQKLFSLSNFILQRQFQTKFKINIFQPNLLGITIWKGILCFFFLLQFVVFPLQIAYKINVEDELLNFLLYKMSLIIFIIEIFISMNTGIYYEGTITIDRIVICKQYFSFKFWVDIMSIVTIYIDDSLFWIFLVFILRYWQIMNIINKFDEQMQLQQRYPTVFQLFKLLFLILSVAHFTGSGFFYVSSYEYKDNNNPDTWIKKHGLINKQVADQYISSLYFSIITMITIGYGDITPVSINEKVYVIIVCLISCCVFALVVNTIGSIFQDISHRESDFKQKKFQLTTYLNMRNIAKKVQIKVLKYLEYINNQEKERIFTQQGEAILQQLSQSIRDEVLIDFYMRLLNQSTLFTLNFSSPFLKQLSLQMKEIILGPTDVLFKEGELDGKLIYINRGQMEMYTTSKGPGENQKSLGLLKDFVHFLLMSLDSLMSKVLIAHTSFIFRSNPFYRQLGNFLKILYDLFQICQKIKIYLYFNNKERYCMMRDEIMLSDKYFEEKCYLCNKDDHQIINCPLIQFRSDKSRAIKVHNYTLNQIRKKYQRIQKNKFHTIISIPKINYIVRKKRLSLLKVDIKKEEDRQLLETDQYNDIEFFLNIPKVVIEDGEIYEQSEDSELSDTDIQMILQDEQHFIDEKNQKLLPIQESSSIKEEEDTEHTKKSIDNNNNKNVLKKSVTCNDELIKMLENQLSGNIDCNYSQQPNQQIIENNQQNGQILTNNEQYNSNQEITNSQKTIFSNQQISQQQTLEQNQQKQRQTFIREKTGKSYSFKQNTEVSKDSPKQILQQNLQNQQSSITIFQASKTIRSYGKKATQASDCRKSELEQGTMHEFINNQSSTTGLNDFHQLAQRHRTTKIRRTLVRNNNQVDQTLGVNQPGQPVNLNYTGQVQLQVNNPQILQEKKKSSDVIILLQGPGGPLFQDFDRLQEYTLYYPKNNLSYILKQFKKKIYEQYKTKLYKFTSKKTFGQRQSIMQHRSSLTQQRKKSEYLANPLSPKRSIFQIN